MGEPFCITSILVLVLVAGRLEGGDGRPLGDTTCVDGRAPVTATEELPRPTVAVVLKPMVSWPCAEFEGRVLGDDFLDLGGAANPGGGSRP